MTVIERFDAMGTWIEVRDASPSNVAEIRRRVEAVEQCCSRFRSSSELSIVNDAEAEIVDISPDLAALFEAAVEIRTRTGGLVDPAVGDRVVGWGYDRTFSEVVDGAAAPRSPWRGAQWHLEGHTLHRAPGVRFDFGGIAKGWTADRIVEDGLASVVSAGGDLRSSDPSTTVDVVDPWGETAVRLALGVGGLATSSTGRRRWVSAGGPAHHIIDPRTGDPAATPVLSATVTAATALEAEAGAKAVLILGAEGLAWAARQTWIRSAVVVWADGNVYATPGVEVAA